MAALGFAWTNVLTQLGMKGARMSPFTALLLKLTGGTVVLVVAVAVMVSLGRSWKRNNNLRR